ncbi:Protein GLUTAMINE DUMPER [Quillaja saponaria]|uniref:Protein GLUTAMINE DUMPER n=1 Tax=Quillaja saponaria TaxID=32244 RepID=A0AAD7VCP7_QUISA|nr:Protein GLUTAMINE DUMPER [Quillaja saponaria]
MRPVNNSTTVAIAGGGGGHDQFRGPIPFLFGGLAVMLALISAALIILACSYRKYSSSSSTGNDEKPATKMVNMEMMDSEPKIVVIMAGETNPTYLAMPAATASTSCHTSIQQPAA